MSIKRLDKIRKFTSGSLCISKGYVSMWILGNQRLSLYHMAHVAQGAWTLNKSIDHDMGVYSPGWPFFCPFKSSAHKILCREMHCCQCLPTCAPRVEPKVQSGLH